VAELPITVIEGDAAQLPGVPRSSVHLVVTSPPYPMIAQWDAAFAREGATTYRAMHDRLRAAWSACGRVLVPGGILAVNVGDAVRSREGEFRLWPNHATLLSDCESLGFRPLPYILWKKPTNKPNAFLGSGFLPPNAYVTLDCEYILLFRNGPLRQLPRHDPAREQSRYSKEDRDHWFSQVWGDVRGVRQGPDGRRTAAFPEEIPRRLIRMFSCVGETVLDPFAGTGTTLWVAAALGRRAIGVERDPELAAALRARASPEGPAGASRNSDGSSLPRRRAAGTRARYR
jgi:modification methylase